MTPSEEQKKAAEIVSSLHARKNTGLTQLEQDIAQALQQAAERAARAVLTALEELPERNYWDESVLPPYDSIERVHIENEISHMRYGLLKAASSAAAPFLKGK